MILTVLDLPSNTLDDTVFKYLGCLGKVEKKKVVLDTFKEGPLSGFQNGDRKYSVEFRSDIIVGPLHVIDGQKVRFSFSGQKKTCFRCFETSYICPGKGVARDCEAAGGPKILLADHLLKFWNLINYTPDKAELPSDLEDKEADYQIGGSFSPTQPVQKHIRYMLLRVFSCRKYVPMLLSNYIFLEKQFANLFKG